MVETTNEIVSGRQWYEKNVYKYSFIYALCSPFNGAVRYVGQSVNPEKRYKQHIYQSRRDSYKNRPKKIWIRRLESIGMKPEMKILERCTNEKGDDCEAQWIRYYLDRDTILLNRDLSFYVTIGTDIPEVWMEKIKKDMKRKGVSSMRQFLRDIIYESLIKDQDKS